jgi:uncharacterized membrane protein
MAKADHVWTCAIGWGVVAGMRSLLPLSLLARGRWKRVGLCAAAVGELLADKLPRMPARTAALPLGGRAFMGALAAALASPAERRVGAAALGLGAAVATSFLMVNLRRLATEGLGVPNAIAGLAEDAGALALGRALARACPAPRSN